MYRACELKDQNLKRLELYIFQIPEHAMRDNNAKSPPQMTTTGPIIITLYHVILQN